MMKIANYQPQSISSATSPAQKNSASSFLKKPRAFAVELTNAKANVQDPSLSGGVQFSKHALQRMHSRGVVMTAKQVAQLSEAMETAQRKGAKETLVLTDDAAFVVSPANKMVISAFDRDGLRDGVFTSIDSAVIL